MFTNDNDSSNARAAVAAGVSAYIFWVSFTLIAIGLMGEFFARKRVSISWFAR